jgi:hypothetical protein
LDEIKIYSLSSSTDQWSTPKSTSLSTRETTYTTTTEPQLTTDDFYTTTTTAEELYKTTEISGQTYFTTEYPYQTSTTTPTTTRSSTSVRTTSIENYPLIYICDFDANDNCGGTIFTNNSGLSHTFSANAQSQVMVATTITDMTSISI